MYSYYLLAAFGPHIQKYLWWKKYLTTLQMVQFIAIMIHAFQLLFIECNYPKAFVWWIGMHAFMFFFLFREFYNKSYTAAKNRRAKEKKLAAANGKLKDGTTNGHCNGISTNGTNDSLRGYSVTLMIACISPADYNQDETISTLRYADRARKIKNKPIINQDPVLAEIMRLRKENGELRLQIMEEGKTFECPPEHKLLQSQLQDTKKKMNQLSIALSEILTQNTIMQEKALSIENAETTLKEKLGELKSVSESFTGDDPKVKELKNILNVVETEQRKLEIQKISFDKNAEHEVDENEEVDDDNSHGGAISERRNEHIVYKFEKHTSMKISGVYV